MSLLTISLFFTCLPFTTSLRITGSSGCTMQRDDENSMSIGPTNMKLDIEVNGAVAVKFDCLPGELITAARSNALYQIQATTPTENRAYGSTGVTRNSAGAESVNGSRSADNVESLYFTGDGITDETLEVYGIRQLFYAMHNASITAHEYFCGEYAPSLKTARFKMAYYPKNDRDNKLLRYGDHTDWLTWSLLFLPLGDTSLELQDALGKWKVPIITKPGTVLLLAGDMMASVRSLLHVPMHRVTNVHNDEDRLSMIYFSGPAFDTRFHDRNSGKVISVEEFFQTRLERIQLLKQIEDETLMSDL